MHVIYAKLYLLHWHAILLLSVVSHPFEDLTLSFFPLSYANANDRIEPLIQDFRLNYLTYYHFYGVCDIQKVSQSDFATTPNDELLSLGMP
jgi:hypothetical protein